nr:immunoglobulin light chain junction region [Macaca mulatta]MOW09638.1 immunoglobulin light chain junction region [Macaca mulatta]
CQQHNSFPTF